MDVPSEAPSSLPQHTHTHQGILPASVGRAAIGTSTSRTISKVFCSFLHPFLKKKKQNPNKKNPTPTTKNYDSLGASPDGAAVKRYLCIQCQHPLCGCSYGFPRTWPGTEKGQPPSQHRPLRPARWVPTLARRQPRTELTVLGHSPPPCTPLWHPPGSSCHHTRYPIHHCGRLQLCQSRNLSHSPAWYGSNLERVPLQTPPGSKQSDTLLGMPSSAILRSRVSCPAKPDGI